MWWTLPPSSFKQCFPLRTASSCSYRKKINVWVCIVTPLILAVVEFWVWISSPKLHSAPFKLELHYWGLSKRRARLFICGVYLSCADNKSHLLIHNLPRSLHVIGTMSLPIPLPHTQLAINVMRCQSVGNIRANTLSPTTTTTSNTIQFVFQRLQVADATLLWFRSGAAKANITLTHARIYLFARLGCRDISRVSK